MTDAELRVIKHALGLSQRGLAYRNHFSAAPGHADFETWDGLVLQGYATKRRSHIDEIADGVPESYIFHVTEAGRKAAGLPPAGRHEN